MTFTVETKERLDHFLVRMMPEESRSRLARMVEEAGVLVEGERITRPGHKVLPGQVVETDPPAPSPQMNLEPVKMNLDVRFEDEHLLVVNKPRGLAVHPAPGLKAATLVNGLLGRSHSLSEEGGSYRPGIVHRLDKDTTGLMMVAKTDAAHRYLAAQLKDKSAERRYLAVIKGQFEHELVTIHGAIGRSRKNPTVMEMRPDGKDAVTHVKTVCETSQGTLAVCRLETGRTHQIRVHLATFGHPVKGDPTYAIGPWSKGPLQLHAAYLKFRHPVSEELVGVQCEPPTDFCMKKEAEGVKIEEWGAVGTHLGLGRSQPE